MGTAVVSKARAPCANAPERQTATLHDFTVAITRLWTDLFTLPVGWEKQRAVETGCC